MMRALESSLSKVKMVRRISDVWMKGKKEVFFGCFQNIPEAD